MTWRLGRSAPASTCRGSEAKHRGSVEVKLLIFSIYNIDIDDAASRHYHRHLATSIGIALLYLIITTPYHYASIAPRPRYPSQIISQTQPRTVLYRILRTTTTLRLLRTPTLTQNGTHPIPSTPEILPRRLPTTTHAQPRAQRLQHLHPRLHLLDLQVALLPQAAHDRLGRRVQRLPRLPRALLANHPDPPGRVSSPDRGAGGDDPVLHLLRQVPGEIWRGGPGSGEEGDGDGEGV